MIKCCLTKMLLNAVLLWHIFKLLIDVYANNMDNVLDSWASIPTTAAVWGALGHKSLLSCNLPRALWVLLKCHNFCCSVYPSQFPWQWYSISGFYANWFNLIGRGGTGL